jgi:hypothetical protein
MQRSQELAPSPEVRRRRRGHKENLSEVGGRDSDRDWTGPDLNLNRLGFVHRKLVRHATPGNQGNGAYRARTGDPWGGSAHTPPPSYGQRDNGIGGQVGVGGVRHLSDSAQRAGWQGFVFDLSVIPDVGILQVFAA